MKKMTNICKQVSPAAYYMVDRPNPQIWGEIKSEIAKVLEKNKL